MSRRAQAERVVLDDGSEWHVVGPRTVGPGDAAGRTPLSGPGLCRGVRYAYDDEMERARGRVPAR